MVHVRFIDGVRAVAVLAVLGFHFAILSSHSPPAWALCGCRGIDLFFVVSGFCLSYPFLRKWRARGSLRIDARSYGSFLARRFSRIAPPYYCALTLFALLAVTPFRVPDAPGLVLAAATTGKEYLLDLLFLTSSSPVFNPSFWTLGVEARWYLLCPLLIGLFVRSRVLFAGAGLAMYALYFSAAGVADEGTLPCFMLGIVAADVILMKRRWRRFAWIGASVFLAAGVIEQYHGHPTEHGDPVWHIACFFLVLTASTGVARRVFEWRPLCLIGLASYSIYLVHGPFMESLVEARVPALLAAAAALIIGCFAYYLVERPLSGASVRGAIERGLAAPFSTFTELRPLKAKR
jgi:peptidoglycan/LPS O-acetylase OafA/YrhL